MEPAVSAFEVRARRAYEWARLQRATWGVAPVALLVGAALLLTARPAQVMALGAVLLIGGVASLWFGHGLQRSVAPGVLAGLLPLTAVTCATRVGHACTGTDCMALCVPACAVGGVAAGLVIGTWAIRKSARAPMWATASAGALLTGAMGCSCAGFTGMVALFVGFLVAGPLIAVDMFRRQNGGAR